MAHVTASKRDYRTNYDPRAAIRETLLPALGTTVGHKYLVALTGSDTAAFGSFFSKRWRMIQLFSSGPVNGDA